MASSVRGRSRWSVALALAVAATLCSAAVASPADMSRTATQSEPSPPQTAARLPVRPNIVVVQTDDLSTNLLKYMPHVKALRRDGLSFERYIVNNSQCCPSRASGLTGRFVHNTHITSNRWPTGGFLKFHSNGQEDDTFAVALENSGYRTAMLGKYLNGYQPRNTMGGLGPFVPPGWTDWAVAGAAYTGLNYELNIDGQIKAFGDEPQDYLTDVLARRGARFIRAAAFGSEPFFLEVNTFAPHAPARPAERHAQLFPDLRAPQGPAFNRVPTNPPPWLATAPALTAEQLVAVNRSFRKRVRTVQAVDELVGRLRRTISAAGIANRTLIVFTSDNGFHLGEHRLVNGKLSDFATDIQVPFIVQGRGIRPGTTVEAPVQNIDQAPTFLELAGLVPGPDVDGRSLVPFLAGGVPPRWRKVALVERSSEPLRRSDPDFQIGPPVPGYRSITGRFTFTVYSDGSTAFYDNEQDPNQLVNLAGELSRAQRTLLRGVVSRMATCAGVADCTAAGRFPRLGKVG